MGLNTPYHNKELLKRVLKPGRLVTYEPNLEKSYPEGHANVMRNKKLEDLPLEMLDKQEDKPKPFKPPRVIPKKFNLVTSLIDAKERTHMPTLDIDIPATLIPSSSSDHYHLYFDVEMSEEDYFKLLDVMAEVGILEDRYVEASKKRGFSSLRLPGAKKKVYAKKKKGPY